MVETTTVWVVHEFFKHEFIGMTLFETRNGAERYAAKGVDDYIADLLLDELGVPPLDRTDFGNGESLLALGDYEIAIFQASVEPEA